MSYDSPVSKELLMIDGVRGGESLGLHLFVHPLPVCGRHLTSESSDDRPPTARPHTTTLFERQTLYQSIQKSTREQVSRPSSIACLRLSYCWNPHNLKSQHSSEYTIHDNLTVKTNLETLERWDNHVLTTSFPCFAMHPFWPSVTTAHRQCLAMNSSATSGSASSSLLMTN